MNKNVKNSPDEPDRDRVSEIKPDKITSIMRQSLLEGVSLFGVKGISLNLLGQK